MIRFIKLSWIIVKETFKHPFTTTTINIKKIK
jgi:hypothetical protein